MFFLLSLLAIWLLRPLRIFRYRRQHAPIVRIQGDRFPAAKPPWVREEILRLYEQTAFSHRKLANLFNQLHQARTGISVGRTWVRELLKSRAYQALHRQKELKHNLPVPLPSNWIWGLDTTSISHAEALPVIVLGMIDHGTRFATMLRRLHRLNAWTLAGCVFLAIGEFGKPMALRLDNHPVHRSKRFRTLMRWAGIRLQFTQPACPWQNGRIERVFGTLKGQMKGLLFLDARQIALSLTAIRFWYNEVRPHQHLEGRTPAQAWRGVDPFRCTPKQKQWFVALDGRLKGWVLRH